MQEQIRARFSRNFGFMALRFAARLPAAARKSFFQSLPRAYALGYYLDAPKGAEVGQLTQFSTSTVSYGTDSEVVPLPKSIFGISSKLTVLAIIFAIAILFIGCNVSVSKHGNDNNEDKNENVDISTPLGGIHVRTEVNPADTGLAVYPYAELTPESKDHDSDQANVNISTPFFGVKIIALHYQTSDPMEKVLDFYKKDMSRYGRVVECKGSSDESGMPNVSGGNGNHEEHGKLTLNCEKAGDNDFKIELKAGEGSSQRIVPIDRKDNRTEFGLVYIQVRGKAETM